MTLDHYDLLLLDYLSEQPTQPEFICSPNADEIFNKPALQLSPEAILQRLQTLQEGNYIQELHRRFDERALALAPKGAAAWEQAFQPDWGKYVQIESYFESDFECFEVSSLDKYKLQDFKQHLTIKCLSSKPVGLIAPWRATYWKTFETGYVLHFKTLEDVSEELAYLQSDWRSLWSQNVNMD